MSGPIKFPMDEHHAVGFALMLSAIIAQREYYSIDEFSAMAEMAYRAIEKKGEDDHVRN